MPDDDEEPFDHGITDDEADEALKEAERRKSDLSSDPNHPNYNAGWATESDNCKDKFGVYPDDPIDEE